MPTPPTFIPPRPPSIETSRSVKPRVLIAEFGDGYTQRRADGLNTQMERITVAWSRLSPADAKTITDFFAARGGVESFHWTAPRDAAPKLWIAESWERGYPNQTHETVRASFREVLI